MAPIYIVLGAVGAYLLLNKPQSVNVTVQAPAGTSSNVSSSADKTPSDIAILDTPHAELISSMNPKPAATPGPAPATVPYAPAPPPPTASTLAPRPTIQVPPAPSAPAPAIVSRPTIHAPPAPSAPAYVERPWTPPAPVMPKPADFGNMSNLDDRDAYAQAVSRAIQINSGNYFVAPESPGGA